VNNVNAIWMGGLANNSRFFGSGTTEARSAATNAAGWNGDWSTSVSSAMPWFMRGERGEISSGAGAFALWSYPGDIGGAIVTHRTILSGY
jgi:hypothetical protein